MRSELMGKVDWGKAFRSVVNTLPGGKQATAAYMAVKKPVAKTGLPSAAQTKAGTAEAYIAPPPAPPRKVVLKPKPKINPMYIGIGAAALLAVVLMGKKG